jgi:gas vesicle protein
MRPEAFMNERSDYVTCVLFFVAGSLAGAGGALLFAPQSGRDTRGRVARRLRRAGRSARDLTERAVRRADRIRGEAARRVEEATAALAGNGGAAAAPPATPTHSR